MTNDEIYSELALKLLGKDLQHLDPEELHVIQSIAKRDVSSRDTHDVVDGKLTYGEHLSDRVAAIGGS